MSYSLPWVPVTSDDVETILSGIVIGATQGKLSGASKLPAILIMITDQVRGAIVSAGIVALSMTPNTVPPEARKHVAVLAAEALAASVPQMSDYVSSDAFKAMSRAANDWIKSVSEGRLVAPPRDPDPNNKPSGPAWGDSSGLADATGTLPSSFDMTTNL